MACWFPAIFLALLVIFTPWVILGLLVIPARPHGLDLPVIMGALALSVPWVVLALTARRLRRR
ncbi:MAG: hypothetical protein ACRDZ7_13295 [Acidimicrobiia bacterium]